MAHYKNRKPKSYKGHCAMCSLYTTNGKRNGRHKTVQEKRAQEAELYYWEYEYSQEESKKEKG